jgi:hypothetical protein
VGGTEGGRGGQRDAGSKQRGGVVGNGAALRTGGTSCVRVRRGAEERGPRDRKTVFLETPKQIGRGS